MAESKKQLAHLLSWTERERGWGQRPDGYSLHISPEACRAYVKAFYARRPAGGPVPDEYTQPDSELPSAILVNEAIFHWVQTEKNIRLWNHEARFSNHQFELKDPETRARLEEELLAKHVQEPKAPAKPSGL